MSKFKGKKTNNAKIDAKIILREQFSMETKKVLEVFCGSGVMFNDVWHKCDHYEGIDIKQYNNEKRIVHIGDAPTVLKQIDLTKFDIFDIDAYGSPYECLFIIIDKLKKIGIHKDIDFIVTDGLQIDLRMGNIEKFMSILSGINSNKINGIHKIHNLIIEKLVANIAISLNCNVENKRIAIGKSGSDMRYYSFTLKKT